MLFSDKNNSSSGPTLALPRWQNETRFSWTDDPSRRFALEAVRAADLACLGGRLEAAVGDWFLVEPEHRRPRLLHVHEVDGARSALADEWRVGLGPGPGRGSAQGAGEHRPSTAAARWRGDGGGAKSLADVLAS